MLKITFELIDFFKVSHLNDLRYKMGASLAQNFKPIKKLQLLDDDEIRMLGTDGLDVSASDVQPQEDGTLGYRGQRVLVYIRDTNPYRQIFELPKFHVSYCYMLKKMSNSGRWQRYVVANREDGYFSVRVSNAKPEFKQLHACQYCLENLRWNGFSRKSMTSDERKNAAGAFSIADFFLKFPKSLFSIRPAYTSDTAAVNAYSDDWMRVSEALKRQKGYQCENDLCKIRLTGSDQKFMHVHHISGQKNDNSISNLKVLCVRCHANEPMHGHMKIRADYKEFVQRYGVSVRHL